MTETDDFRFLEIDENILRVLLEGRDTDDPWGRASPGMISDALDRDVSPEYVVNRLSLLNAAGHVRKRAKGVYEITDAGMQSIEGPYGE